MNPMTVKLEDRPIESLREEVVDQLTMNYGHGELSLEAFERRLDIAMEAKDHKLLAAQVEDLTLEVDNSFKQHKQDELGQRFDPSEPKEFESITQVLSNNSRSGVWNVAKETRFYSLLSGGNIDLTNATFTHHTVYLKIYSLLSGHKIFVPENIHVVCKASCLVGNFENETSSVYEGNPPTLVIEGVSILSSLKVEIKRTFKEKMLDFADTLKKMFV